MDGKYLSEIPIKEYFLQSDEVLQEIMADYSEQPSDYVLEFRKYKVACDILRIRANEKLVAKTRNLALATWFLAIFTIITAIITTLLNIIPAK